MLKTNEGYEEEDESRHQEKRMIAASTLTSRIIYPTCNDRYRERVSPTQACEEQKEGRGFGNPYRPCLVGIVRACQSANMAYGSNL